jgi:hypothetical protein
LDRRRPDPAAIAAHRRPHRYIGSFELSKHGRRGDVRSGRRRDLLRRLHGDGSERPNIVYLGTGQTMDGGATWSSTNAVRALSRHRPDGPNIVYAGGNGFLMKTIDGGDTWTVMDGMVTHGLLHHRRPGSELVYAGAAGEGRFQSATVASPGRSRSTRPYGS